MKHALKHLSNVVLEKIPVIKELLEAYHRTIGELDDNFERLEGQIKDETISAIAQAIPRLQQLPEFADQSVRMLSYSARQFPQDDVVDGEFEVPATPK